MFNGMEIYTTNKSNTYLISGLKSYTSYFFLSDFLNLFSNKHDEL